MPNYKLQSPLVINNNGIYPLTTVDQVILDDNSRLNSKMVTIDLNTENDEVTKLPTRDADTLGGIPANKYALKDNLAVIDNYITTMTAEDFEALTIEEKQELYSQGVRIITVDRDLDSDNLSDMQRFAQFVYPVGSIVELTIATNPATLWGFGTWESVKDRFLIGAGGSYSAGSTGGEATHTLTIDEMPLHDGHLYGKAGNVDGKGNAAGAWLGSSNMTINSAQTTSWGWDYDDNEYYPTSRSLGSGTAHNNMPPYLAVYMWKRTA